MIVAAVLAVILGGYTLLQRSVYFTKLAFLHDELARNSQTLGSFVGPGVPSARSKMRGY
jgi:hypothetical protein